MVLRLGETYWNCVCRSLKGQLFDKVLDLYPQIWCAVAVFLVCNLTFLSLTNCLGTLDVERTVKNSFQRFSPSGCKTRQYLCTQWSLQARWLWTRNTSRWKFEHWRRWCSLCCIRDYKWRLQSTTKSWHVCSWCNNLWNGERVTFTLLRVTVSIFAAGEN